MDQHHHVYERLKWVRFGIRVLDELVDVPKRRVHVDVGLLEVFTFDAPNDTDRFVDVELNPLHRTGGHDLSKERDHAFQRIWERVLLHLRF